jgi:hypothetical protein
VTNDGRNGEQTHPGCPCEGDQPLLGIDANGVYITTNEFPINGPGFNGAQIYAIQKSALVAGTTPNVQRFEGTQGPVPLASPNYQNGIRTPSPRCASARLRDHEQRHRIPVRSIKKPFHRPPRCLGVTNTASLN